MTHPSIILALGSALMFAPQQALQQLTKLGVPLIIVAISWLLSPGMELNLEFMGYALSPMKVDSVSALYLRLFALIGLVVAIFGLNRSRQAEFSGGFLYLAAALGTVLAGDWISFLVFWELLTVGAFILIYVGGQEQSIGAALRYAMFHLFGGLFILVGILLHVMSGAELGISQLDFSTTSAQLIFIGMGVNVGFPLFHFWIVDSYPEGSPGGSILLAALTTKIAVYGFLRAFPGTELLVLIGAVMAVFPLVFAYVERDYRRCLAYCLLNPVGFMLIGIGLGTDVAIQGALAFVVSHVLYKSLLFLAAGSLMYAGVSMRMDQPVNVKLSRLHRVLFILGGFIMVMPGTSGYVSKALLLDEVKSLGFGNLYYLMVISSLVVFLIAALKPLRIFFKNEFDEQEQLPYSTIVAALILVVTALALGIVPDSVFFKLLPGHVESHPNELGHILQQCGYVVVTALVFLVVSRIRFMVDTREYDVQRYWSRVCALFYRLFERLNVANHAAATCFVKWLPAALYEGVPKASDSLLQAIFIPYWSLQGDTPMQVKRKVSLLRAENKDGFFPIGFTIIAATLLFLLMFAFYRLK